MGRMATKTEMTPKDKYEVLLNLTPEDVMKRIGKIKDVGNTIAFELGILLKRVRDEQMWKLWDGQEYPSFAEWVFKVIGKNIRSAQYYITVNEKLAALKLDDDWMRKAIQLGWVKLHEILKVADNKTEFKKWYIKALNQGERTLKADVRAAQANLPPGEQKPDLDYDEDGKEVPTIPFTFQFQNSDEWEHFNKALELAEQVTGDKKNSKCLDHIATYYMAHASTHIEGGTVMDVQDILLALKETYSLELAIFNKDTEEWIPIRREEEDEEDETPSKKKSKKSPEKSSVPKKGKPPKKGKKNTAA